MPKEDKEIPLWAVLLSIALTILVTAGISVAIFQGPSQLSKEHVTAKAEYHAAKCDKEEAVRFGAKHPVGPFKKDAEAKYGKEDARAKLDKPNHCDLAAQYLAASSAEATADYAALTVWLTAIGVGLLAWTLKATRDTLDEARSATIAAENTAAVTREVGEAAERAGLHIVYFNKWKGSAIFNFEIENFGKSAALNVVVRGTCKLIISDGGNLKTVHEEIKSYEFPKIGQAKVSSGDLDFFADNDEFQTILDNGIAALVECDIEIFYEDVFTIGTKRDVNITTQRFLSDASGEKTDQNGDTKMGKKQRPWYALAKVN